MKQAIVYFGGLFSLIIGALVALIGGMSHPVTHVVNGTTFTAITSITTTITTTINGTIYTASPSQLINMTPPNYSIVVIGIGMMLGALLMMAYAIRNL